MRESGSEPSSTPSNNQQRLCSALDYLTPEEHERKHSRRREMKGRISVTREVSAIFLVSVWGWCTPLGTAAY